MSKSLQEQIKENSVKITRFCEKEGMTIEEAGNACMHVVQCIEVLYKITDP